MPFRLQICIRFILFFQPKYVGATKVNIIKFINTISIVDASLEFTEVVFYIDFSVHYFYRLMVK